MEEFIADEGITTGVEFNAIEPNAPESELPVALSLHSQEISEQGLAAITPESSTQEPESYKSWLRKHAKTIVIGGALATAAAIAAPQVEPTVHEIAANARWALPALASSEAFWDSGAAVMLAAVGAKVINAATIKSRYHEASQEFIEKHSDNPSEASLAVRGLSLLVASSKATWAGIKGITELRNQIGELKANIASVRHNKTFKAGFIANQVGELGTFGILVGGSIAALPSESWPLTMGVATGLVSFPTVPLWIALAKAHQSDKKSKLLEQDS